MFKKIAIAITAGLTLALAGCGTINKASQAIGANIEFVDVYQIAEGFAENAYVTIRLYEATIDTALFACDVTVNPDAGKTPDQFCEEAAKAATELTPRVNAADELIGQYVGLEAEIRKIKADGGVPPIEKLEAVTRALYEARIAWLNVEPDVKSFLND